MRLVVETTDFKFYNSAVTLGKFDGIHLGHQKLIAEVVSCKKDGLVPVVFSFAMHPNLLLSHKKQQLIYSKEEKREILANLGVEILIEYPFNYHVASMEAEDFVERILVGKLDAKVIVVGEDYCFGHNRQGNASFLKSLENKYHFKVVIIPKVSIENGIVSSTRIRSELEIGNVAMANKLLGRPYNIKQEVIHGRQLGRTMEVPTINFLLDDIKLVPKNGVYASLTYIDGVGYPGITNVGYKPTVGATKVPGVETHIFNYNKNLYGRVLNVELYEFLRDERCFEGLSMLKEQMAKDIEFSKEYFKNHKK